MACYHAVVRYSLIKPGAKITSPVLSQRKHSPRFFTNLYHATTLACYISLYLLCFIRQIYIYIFNSSANFNNTVPNDPFKYTHLIFTHTRPSVQDNAELVRYIQPILKIFIQQAKYCRSCIVDFEKGSRQSDKIEASKRRKEIHGYIRKTRGRE